MTSCIIYLVTISMPCLCTWRCEFATDIDAFKFNIIAQISSIQLLCYYCYNDTNLLYDLKVLYKKTSQRGKKSSENSTWHFFGPANNYARFSLQRSLMIMWGLSDLVFVPWVETYGLILLQNANCWPRIALFLVFLLGLSFSYICHFYCFLSQMKDNAIIHKIKSNLVGINSFQIQFWVKNTYFWPFFLVNFDQKNPLILHSIFFQKIKNFDMKIMLSHGSTEQKRQSSFFVMTLPFLVLESVEGVKSA